jgi:hypothetical protein
VVAPGDVALRACGLVPQLWCDGDLDRASVGLAEERLLQARVRQLAGDLAWRPLAERVRGVAAGGGGGLRRGGGAAEGARDV